MDINVTYSAASNISYRGTWVLTIDDEEWVDMTDAEREQLVEEMATARLFDDISLSWSDWNA